MVTNLEGKHHSPFYVEVVYWMLPWICLMTIVDQLVGPGVLENYLKRQDLST